jgi:hypothetical protein
MIITTHAQSRPQPAVTRSHSGGRAALDTALTVFDHHARREIDAHLLGGAHD